MFKRKKLYNIRGVLREYYKETRYGFFLNDCPKIQALEASSFISRDEFYSYGAVGWEYLLTTMISESIYDNRQHGFTSSDIKLIVKHLDRIVNKCDDDILIEHLFGTVKLYYIHSLLELLGNDKPSNNKALTKLYTIRMFTTLVMSLMDTSHPKFAILDKLRTLTIKRTVYELLEKDPRVGALALYDDKWVYDLTETEKEIDHSKNTILDSDILFGLICTFFDTLRPCGPRNVKIEASDDLSHMMQYAKFTPVLIDKIKNITKGYFSSQMVESEFAKGYFTKMDHMEIDTDVRNDIQKILSNSSEMFFLCRLKPRKVLTNVCNAFHVAHMGLQLERIGSTQNDKYKCELFAQFKATKLVLDYICDAFHIWSNPYTNRYFRDKSHSVMARLLDIAPEMYTWLLDYEDVTHKVRYDQLGLCRVINFEDFNMVCFNTQVEITNDIIKATHDK